MASRVLLVEDEPNIVESLRFLLTRAGFEVRVETDGAAAFAAARAFEPTVVVLDVMLPGRDGFEVLRDLRAEPRTATLPVVMLTAKGLRQDRARAMDEGADAFITKPFENREVVETVMRLAHERPDVVTAGADPRAAEAKGRV